MSVNRLNIFQRILVTQLNHWTCFSVLFLYFIVNHARSENASLQIGAWLLFGLVPAGLYLTGIYINKKIIFWAIHVGIVVVAGLLPMESLTHKLIYLGMTFIYSMLSILSHYGKESIGKKYFPLPVYFGISVVALLFLQYMELHEYQRYYLYLLILQVFLCCVTMYADRYLDYVELHKHSIGYMPIQNTFVAGIKVIGTFSMVVSLVLMTVASIGEMNDILGYFRKTFRKIMKKLIEFLRNLFKNLRDNEEILTDNSLSNPTLITDSVQDAASSVLVDIVVLILFIIVMIYAAKCFIKIVFSLLGMLKLPQDMPEEEDISPDIQEEIRDISKEKRRRFDLFAGTTPAEKIRKRYKKKIEGSKEIITAKGKREQMEVYTARESADILAIPELGDLYEKARYSPYECTPEDVKQMKLLCKSKK